MRSITIVCLLLPLLLWGKDLKITHFTLDNGLRVYLSEDHRTPTVALSLYYDVGSRNEVKGKTGFAHLFEHMMFQGSRNVDKGEHFTYIENNGGSANANTSRERTHYFQNIPANQLPLGLWLEADRMAHLLVTDLNFENQRQVVKEEKLSRYDNRPYGKLFLELEGMAYDHPDYQHSVIGSIKDLDGATVLDAQKFHQKFYTPDNAVLTIVGDIQIEQAQKQVKQYFDKIPKGAVKRTVKKFKQGNQTKKRFKKILDPLAKQPALAFAFKAPSAMSQDYFSLAVLEQVLLNNMSSRLHQILVKEKGYALSISGGIGSNRGPNLFYIYAIIKRGKVDVVRKIIKSEIAKIQANGISTEELQRAKRGIKTDFIFKLESTLSRAVLIGEYALYFNQPELINKEYQHYESVTAEMVQNAAKLYLISTKESELEVTIR